MTFVTYITKSQKSSLPMKFISRYINMQREKTEQSVPPFINGYFLNAFHTPCTVLSISLYAHTHIYTHIYRYVLEIE